MGVALAIGLAVLALAAIKASHKPFWFDEAHELTETCSQRTSQMLLQGAWAQCSASPLYYLLEQTEVRAIKNLTPNGAINHLWITDRLISILSASACAMMVFWILFSVGGSTAAFCGVLSLLSQNLFWTYAAEARPYMLWLFLFTVWVGMSGHFLRRLQQSSVKFLCIAVALSGVATAGAVQVLGLIAVDCALRVTTKTGLAWELREYLRSRWVVLTLIMALLMGWFYARPHCPYLAPVGIYDLVRTRNPQLVFGVLRLLVQKGVAFFVPNFAFLVVVMGGVATLWKALQSKQESSGAEQALSGEQALTISLVIQLAVSVALAYTVASQHYFFIPRVFIYFLVCKAIGAGLGLGWLERRALQLSERHLRGRSISWVVSLIAVSASGVALLPIERSEIGQILSAKPPPPEATAPAGICSAGASPFQLLAQPSISVENQLNSAVALTQSLEACKSRVLNKSVGSWLLQAVPGGQN